MYRTRSSKSFNKRTVLLLLLVLGVILVPCLDCTNPSADKNDTINTPATSPVTKMVIADSGAILSNLTSGLQLRLSPGALPLDTTVTVVEIPVAENSTLFEAAVNFTPEHMLTLEPCTVVVPLGKSYDGPKSLEIWEFSGSDPSFALPSGRYADVILGIGGYFAVAEVVHFSGEAFSRVCHSGTIRRILEDFDTRGCNPDAIFSRVNKQYPDANLSNNNVETAGPAQVQALLDTYFDDVGAWAGGTDVPQATIDLLTQQVKSGRSVVLAFGPAVVGLRSGVDNFYDCDVKKYRHTAVVQMAADGTVQIVNTVSVSAKLRSQLNMQEIVVNCPLSSVNQFREEKQGVMLEQELCGSAGCLSDSSLNPWKIAPFNPVDGGAYWLDWGRRSWSERLLAIYDQKLGAAPDTFKPRPVPWRDVRIYLQKPVGPSGSPCDTAKNDTAWAEIIIEDLYSKTLTPGYTAAFCGDITSDTTVVVAGCPTVFLTNGDTINALNYDVLSFVFNPQLPGPGTYSVSTSDIVDGGYENVFFSTPQVPNYMPAINGPVIFTEQNGTITIESFGTKLGDVLEGTFDFTIEGRRYLDVNTQDTLTGTVKGMFRSVIRAASEIRY